MLYLKKIREEWGCGMIENDWDEIRKEAFRLVRKYRENENLKTWEEKIDQEKRARINV